MLTPAAIMGTEGREHGRCARSRDASAGGTRTQAQAQAVAPPPASDDNSGLRPKLSLKLIYLQRTVGRGTAVKVVRYIRHQTRANRVHVYVFTLLLEYLL